MAEQTVKHKQDWYEHILGMDEERLQVNENDHNPYLNNIMTFKFKLSGDKLFVS